MSDSNGRVIVVCGAGGNLGAATARAFASRGAKLALFDRSRDQIEKELSPELASGHLAFAVDLAYETAVARSLSEVHSKLGRIDALVNTVGGYLGGSPLADTEWTAFEKMLLLNLKVAHATSRAVLPHLRAAGGGHIVHVASLAALSGNAGESAYAASKAALVRLCESLANEVKLEGITVNCVMPGSIDTPQNRAWMNEAQIATAVDPSAIADVLIFLASDAARAVTGAAIRVTGKQ